MKYMIKRNLKIYFKDKGAVFFSLLGVAIIFCLFIFFIGDSITEGLDFLDNADYVMNSWVVAGMLASSAITTSMGAYAVMVNDKEKKCIKDFYSSPLKRSSVTAGYMLAGFFVSVIMSVFTLIFGEIYIVARGGEFLAFSVLVKVLGVILLSSFASSAMVCFIVSLLKTNNAYTMVSILLGTLIGFLVGAYVTMGSLPEGVQWVIKCFPCAHAAALFRQLLMQDGMAAGFADLSAQTLTEFKETTGVVFVYNSHTAQPWVHLAVLAATGVVFYLLATLRMTRKEKQI